MVNFQFFTTTACLVENSEALPQKRRRCYREILCQTCGGSKCRIQKGLRLASHNRSCVSEFHTMSLRSKHIQIFLDCKFLDIVLEF